MNYEKKYKNVLEKIRNEYDRIKYLSSTDARDMYLALREIFPELAESEDEKMRKGLVDFVKVIKSAIEEGRTTLAVRKDELCLYTSWIAWLEKQKAKEDLDRMAPIYEDKESFESALEKAWKFYNDSGARTVDSCEDNYIECTFSKGFREGFLYKEKQKEPLPIPDKFSGLKSLMLQYLQSAANRKDDTEIESDTDLFGRKILDYVWKYSDEQKEQKPKITDYEISLTTNDEQSKLKAVGDVYENIHNAVEQKPAEWSEEDEKIITALTKALIGSDSAEKIMLFDGVTIEMVSDWLKSLRPQSKQEWNEEGSEKELDEFTENIRRLITEKLTYHATDGSGISSTVFIDDATAKDIANGVLFYAAKEPWKNPDREISDCATCHNRGNTQQYVKGYEDGKKEAEQRGYERGYAKGYEDGQSAVMWKHPAPLPTIPPYPAPYQPSTTPGDPYFGYRVTCTTTSDNVQTNNEEHHEEEQ